LFRIDENTIIDATRKGSIARFMNHSCDVSLVPFRPRDIVVLFARVVLHGVALRCCYVGCQVHYSVGSLTDPLLCCSPIAGLKSSLFKTRVVLPSMQPRTLT
jgi:hypothetical protein